MSILATPPAQQLAAVKTNGSPRPDQPHQANHIFSPQTRNRQSRNANSKPQPLAAVIQLLSVQVVLFQLQSETRSARTRLQEMAALRCPAPRSCVSGESCAVRASNDPLGVCRSQGGRLLELASGRAARGQSRAGCLSLVWCAE